jgi:hypothetical protein
MKKLFFIPFLFVSCITETESEKYPWSVEMSAEYSAPEYLRGEISDVAWIGKQKVSFGSQISYYGAWYSEYSIQADSIQWNLQFHDTRTSAYGDEKIEGDETGRLVELRTRTKFSDCPVVLNPEIFSDSHSTWKKMIKTGDNLNSFDPEQAFIDSSLRKQVYLLEYRDESPVYMDIYLVSADTVNPELSFENLELWLDIYFQDVVSKEALQIYSDDSVLSESQKEELGTLFFERCSSEKLP